MNKMGDWISVDSGFPKDQMEVLGFSPDSHEHLGDNDHCFELVMYERERGVWFYSETGVMVEDKNITGWMYLFPPEEIEESQEEIAKFIDEAELLFYATWRRLQKAAHENSVAKGWWEGDRNDGEMIALMHSELSEALEGMRHGNPQSEHIPEFSAVEEEFADVIIRMMDYAEDAGLDIPSAVVAKMAFNLTRPHKHGGKKF